MFLFQPLSLTELQKDFEKYNELQIQQDSYIVQWNNNKKAKIDKLNLDLRELQRRPPAVVNPAIPNPVATASIALPIPAAILDHEPEVLAGVATTPC